MELQNGNANNSVEANNVRPCAQGLTVRAFARSAAVVILMVAFFQPTVAGAAAIVDTLAIATPTTQFSVFGAGGQAIFSEQFVGPQFTLQSSAVLTEIGAFVNNCATIFIGVPQCPDTLPFIVQIRRSVGGIPDRSTVLASFTLSHDNDPFLVSFESVAFNLSLGTGTYFALFGPQQLGDAGFLLGTASSPFSYVAGTTTLGFLNSTNGVSFVSSSPLAAAVRISAAAGAVDEPSTMLLLATGVFVLLAHGLAGLSMAPTWRTMNLIRLFRILKRGHALSHGTLGHQVVSLRV